MGNWATGQMLAAITERFPSVIASIIESYAEEQTYRTELLKARVIIEAVIRAKPMDLVYTNPYIRDRRVPPGVATLNMHGIILAHQAPIAAQQAYDRLFRMTGINHTGMVDAFNPRLHRINRHRHGLCTVCDVCVTDPNVVYMSIRHGKGMQELNDAAFDDFAAGIYMVD